MVGGLRHGGNRLVPGRAALGGRLQGGWGADGQAIFRPETGVGLELDAVADVARETGLTLIPTTYLWGGVGPIVADDVYEMVRAKIVTERGVRSDVLFLHAPLFDDNLVDAFFDGPHRLTSGYKLPTCEL